MSAKTTVVLLVLVAVGCLLVVGADQGWFGKDQAEQDKPPMQQFAAAAPAEAKDVFEDHPADVTTLSLTSDDQTVTFAKGEGDTWEIVEPIKAPALKWPVDGLVRTVIGLTYQQRYAPGQPGSPTAAQTGLDDPIGTVTFEYENGSATVVIGKTETLGKGTYVKLGDKDAVYLVTADLGEFLDKDLSEFRDKDLIKAGFSDIRRLDVVSRDPAVAFTLVRKGDHEWVMESPIKGRASSEGGSDIIAVLTELEIDEFVEDGPKDLAKYGLADPVTRVTMTIRKAVEKDAAEPVDANEPTPKPTEPEYTTETAELLIGGYVGLQKEHRFAMLAGSDTVAAVKQARVKDLTPELLAVRDRRLTPANTYKATKLVVTDPVESVTLAKVDGKWTLTEPTEAEADRSAVQSVLTGLRSVQAERFVDRRADLADAGLDTPSLELKVYVEGQADPEIIRVGNRTPSGRMVYLHRVGDESAMVVKVADAEKLMVPAAAFGSRKMLAVPVGQVARATVTHDGVTMVLGKEDWQWRIEAPTEGAADQSGVATILGDVANLHAKRIVARGDAKAYGLDAPAVTLSVTASPPTPATTQPTTQAAPEPVTYTLLVSKVGDAVYAMVEGNDLVYEIESEVYDHLTAELNDRRVLPFSPMQVVRLAITGSAVTDQLTFAKADGAWTYELDEFFPLDGGKVDERVRSLRGLQAERFVDLSADDLAVYGLAEPAIRTAVTTSDDRTYALRISATGPSGPEQRYAVVEGDSRVFVLGADQLKSFAATLGDFEKGT